MDDVGEFPDPNYSTDSSPVLSSTYPGSPVFLSSTEDEIEREMPPVSLPPPVQPASSPLLTNTSRGLIEIMRMQLQQDAKARRMRRMQILKAKRLDGTISFMAPVIRYQNKRRN